MITLVATSVEYFSQGDEDSFFAWLQGIPCVGKVHGVNVDLLIELKTDLVQDDDLRELTALFYRYGVDMRQLKKLVTKRNADWYRDDTETYWHDRVFGAGE